MFSAGSEELSVRNGRISSTERKRVEENKSEAGVKLSFLRKEGEVNLKPCQFYYIIAYVIKYINVE
jgi:hypothetical protein